MNNQEQQVAEQIGAKVVADTIDRYKYLIILIGVPLLIAFLRSIVVDLLVKDARRISDKANLTDQDLAKHEADARQKADDIITTLADKLNNKPVTEDWNK